jgi:hypothetical protein
MKKIIAVKIIILLAFSSVGQINKGTIVAGGYANFNNRITHTGAQNSSASSLTVQPQFGIALTENFIAGAFVSFRTFSDFYKGFAVSPFLRYYVKNFYLQAGYGYSFEKSVAFNTEGSYINVDLGHATFLTKNVALEPALYYNGVIRGKQYEYTNYGIKLGLQIYFNRD